METRILPADSPDTPEIAGEIIKNGGLVAIPTETVYGLGADGLNPEAVAKIFKAKGRPQDNPLILHIIGPEQIPLYCHHVPAAAYALAEAFWPGPLTMVLPARETVPKCTTAGLSTVGIRCPDSAVTRAIIAKAGVPIAAPSANISGKPSTTTAEHVLHDHKGRIEAVVDGGPCRVGVESTIVDLTEERPRLLRPGGITPEQLLEVLGDLVVDKAVTAQIDKDAVVKAPGMKYRHYAPKAKMYVVEDKEALKLLPLLAKEAAKFTTAAVICGGEAAETMQRAQNLHILNWGVGTTELAVKLYRLLRRCDKLGVGVIFSEGVTEDGIGLAVMNRMRKAAGRQVLTAADIEALLKNSTQLKSFVLK